MYKNESLSNGLRIVTHDIKDRASIALGFWIGVGGRHESDSDKGAAHFLEHIVFKGSQKYTCEEIKEKIEGVGGALNAFTSEEQTCFYAKIPAKHLDSTFDILSDMVVTPLIKSRDVEKEKTVILEEIKMYHDLPQYYVMELLDGLLWPGHPLGKSLPGTPETVSGLSNKDLKRFHQSYYAPKNIVVSACGKLSHSQVSRLSKAKFGSLKSFDVPDFEHVKDEQQSPRVHFYKKDIEQMHLALGMPAYHENHPDRYTLSLLSIILGGNMSSRLFVEVREKKGLAYSIGSSAKNLHDTGVFMVRAGVDNNKVVDAVSVILRELKKIKRSGVNDSEFVRAKDYLLGQILLGLEDTMEHMLWIGEAMLSKNKLQTMQSLVRTFEKITPEDIRRVAKDILIEEKYNLALVGPLTHTQEKELKSVLNV